MSDCSYLATIIRDREIKSQLENTRVEAVKLILDGTNPDKVKEQLDVIDKQETIYTKITSAFPGYFGQLIILSFKSFLGDKLEDDKVQYYEQFIELLDEMPDLELEEDEKQVLEEASKEVSKIELETANQKKDRSFYNLKEWVEKNKVWLEQYKSFKECDLYLKSPIYSIQEKVKNFIVHIGYYENAIPLIRNFSPLYDEYYKQLLEANQKYIDKYI